MYTETLAKISLKKKTVKNVTYSFIFIFGDWNELHFLSD